MLGKRVARIARSLPDVARPLDADNVVAFARALDLALRINGPPILGR